MDGFTPTEQRIMDLLMDGAPHHKEELKGMLYSNGHGSKSTLIVHICNIRKKLLPGYEIVCQVYNRRYHYRLVRLVSRESE